MRRLALLALLPAIAHAQWAGSGMLVRDEGTSKGYAKAVNCVGAGVTCASDGFTWTLKVLADALPVYADNATARAAGLAVGALYRTAAGQLMVAF